MKEDLEPDTVLKLMANLLDLKSTSSETKTWVLLAMAKQCEGGSTDVSVTRKVCETYSSSLDTVLRQRAQELQYLSQDSELQARVLPRDASREPLEVTKARRPAGFHYYVLSDCSIENCGFPGGFIALVPGCLCLRSVGCRCRSIQAPPSAAGGTG